MRWLRTIWYTFFYDGGVSPRRLIELSSVENMSESMRQAHEALLLMANAGVTIGTRPTQEDDELLVSYPEMR